VFSRLRARLAEWRRKQAEQAAQRAIEQAAIDRALERFRATRGTDPMGAHVLGRRSGDVIVRVMYLTDHIPPDRAWYAVPEIDAAGAVRELSFAEVADLETPWR
jgi:hypothetical protein